MEILWLIVGFVIGVLAAWLYLNAEFKKRFGMREAELLQEVRSADERATKERDAHQTTKNLLSELEANQTQTAEQSGPAPTDTTLMPHSPVDDLTKIKGIGPVLRDKLHQLGITSFRQIAEFTQADIARVYEVLDFPGRIEREEWVEQAKTMVNR